MRESTERALLIGGAVLGVIGIAYFASRPAAAATTPGTTPASTPLAAGMQAIQAAPGAQITLIIPTGATFSSATLRPIGTPGSNLNPTGTSLTFTNPSDFATVSVVWKDASGTAVDSLIVLVPPGAILSTPVSDTTTSAAIMAQLTAAAQRNGISAVTSAVTPQAQVTGFQSWFNAQTPYRTLTTLPTSGVLDYQTAGVLNYF